MSWPNLSESVLVLDVSIYQNRYYNTDTPERGRIDFDELKKLNPEITGIISRAAGSWSGADPDFQHNYDKSGEAGFDQVAYVNQNPDKTWKWLLDEWKKAIGSRIPKAIVLDCESFGYPPKSPEVITSATQDNLKAIADTWPEAHIIDYTARWAWDSHWVHGWESDIYLWAAHWIYVVQEAGGDWRCAEHFDEITSVLPIDNGFTPVMPAGYSKDKLVGWQCSERGIIAPITKNLGDIFAPRVDLNFFKKIFWDMVFDKPISPPIPAPEKPIVTISYNQSTVELNVIEE